MQPDSLLDVSAAGRTFSIRVEDTYGQKGALSVHLGNHSHMVGTTDLRDGKWHHIAVTFETKHKDRTLGKTTIFYVDGKREAISKLKTRASYTIFGNTLHRTWDIGICTDARYDRFRMGADRKLEKFFEGDIDHVRVWRARLIASQIREQAGPTSSIEVGLFIDAEEASEQRLFAPFQVKSDQGAAGGEYIVVPNGTGNGGIPSNQKSARVEDTFVP